MGSSASASTSRSTSSGARHSVVRSNSWTTMPPGRAPDGVAVDVEEVDPVAAVRRVVPALGLVVRGVGQSPHGEDRDLRHLRLVGHVLAVGSDADERSDPVLARRPSVVEPPDDVDLLGAHPDLLARLPEGGVGQGSVLRLAAAAREAHLSRVSPEVRRALREQQVGLAVALEDGGEHRRLATGSGHRLGRVPTQPRQVHTRSRHPERVNVSPRSDGAKRPIRPPSDRAVASERLARLRTF